MARKITELAIDAFMSGREFNRENTQVTILNERDDVFSLVKVVYLKLHGHKIAKRFIVTGETMVTNAGWNTRTTNERLNGIPGVSVYNKGGKLFLNGVEWSGEWTKI